MHIKKPRLWSPSTRSNFEMAVPSSAQFIECGGSRSSTPCTRSNVEMAVPSPAQFIECGGSRSSTPCTTQIETIPPKKRHILTDIEIDDILNFGSEEESESEDEAFPIFVPRTAFCLTPIYRSREDMAGKDDNKPESTETGIDENVSNDDDSENIREEYEILDSKLDELNLALDFLERKNDDIHKKLKELLQSNIDIRQQLKNENCQGSDNE
ncbi:unnamed protein product [Parnassius apollo]|uniref:(apollo) hypothetical protein n=1 Tax=Parnassius apollo TaxID=110799 RepID=A0A8S3XHY1_PARAO|nr:unnamed protein product [Parnassius apollo]